MREISGLADGAGIVGVHLCRADDAISRIETAEKQARSDGTQIPRWIVMIEAGSADILVHAAQALRHGLNALGVTAFDEASYRLEHQRCKLPTGDRPPAPVEGAS